MLIQFACILYSPVYVRHVVCTFVPTTLNIKEIKMPIKKRPQIKIGDVVRISRKGIKYHRRLVDKTLVVITIKSGDGVDGTSRIKCMVESAKHHEFHTFYRGHLWYTGHNIHLQSNSAMTTAAGRKFEQSQATNKNRKSCSCPWSLVYSEGCKCGGC